MTYHAELAPRRRPWLIAIPLILVLALAVAVERHLVLRGGRGRGTRQ